MPTSPVHPQSSPSIPPYPGLLARLPGGEWLVPGDDPEAPAAFRRCVGPDVWGGCPIALSGGHPVCEGAEWLLETGNGRRTWRLRFLDGTGLCPAAYIEPLRALRQRQDPSSPATPA